MSELTKRMVGSISCCKRCRNPIQLAATYVDGSEYWWHFGVGPSHYAIPLDTADPVETRDN